MALSMTFLGHSGFVFDDGNHKLAIDPFLTGNPVAKAKPEDVRCSYIALTHGHEDHVGDTESIAKTNDATVLAAFEICNYLGKQGVKKLEPGNPGGKINTDFGWVAFTQAFHSSSYQGQYMGLPCGLIVNMGGATVYHCGDTALFGDMKLIGEIYKPDIACIPIGDRFTMGPELGTRAAEFIKPKVAIPIHYATFPGMLVPDASGFTPTGVEVKILEPGETWRYG
ncbi:MAG: metal-dependent hydrolase [Planctomycetota bacterium]|nr:metal-dependent hydrolase [Planctomycetota bacterium]